jgi:hypothetical protein
VFVHLLIQLNIISCKSDSMGHAQGNTRCGIWRIADSDSAGMPWNGLGGLMKSSASEARISVRAEKLTRADDPAYYAMGR